MISSVPLIPGYQAVQPRKEKYPLKQTLEWKKGVPVSSYSPIMTKLDEIELEDTIRKELSLQFGGRRPTGSDSRFLPKWAIYEKKILQFNGYYTESLYREKDVYCVRQIILRYHLLDDTISIHEPKSYNSGLPQGLLLKRQRVPRSNAGDKHLSHLESEGENAMQEDNFWHWSDLNRGVVMSIYGRKYTLCDCDHFTKEFLLSEGTELMPPVEVPADPYDLLRLSRRETPHRMSDLRPKSSKSGVSRIFGDLVLKFDVMVEEVQEWNRGKATAAVLSYRMSDDKIEIRKSNPEEDLEIKRFSPLILRWSKVPLKHVTRSSIADVGEEEEFASRHLTAAHLAPPATVDIFGRKVLVTGCDGVTADVLERHYGIVGAPILTRLEEKSEGRISRGRMSSDIVLRNRPTQGVLGVEEAKVLRFSAKLCRKGESDEETRNYILTFHTIDSSFEIYEKPQPGGFGGRVMSRTKIPKPSCSSEPGTGILTGTQKNICYYTLKDLDIGNSITARGREYEITGADRYVKTFAESDPQFEGTDFLKNLRNYFKEEEYKEEIEPKTRHNNY